MKTSLDFLIKTLDASWSLFLEAAPFILLGLVVAGLLKVFLSPAYVAKHLGQGRFSSVIKAALLGIPMPLCSCGVLPAAAALKEQGANNGATTSFLIATPESGVDSISITYALLDPIMTVARPVAAFVSSLVAGFTVNIVNPPAQDAIKKADLKCPFAGCDEDGDNHSEGDNHRHSFLQKTVLGFRYAATDIWTDLAGWFFGGIGLAGVITVIVPDNIFAAYLGGGFSSMLLMLAFGIPLYICATASTPIAVALILKGVSPGAALVFLLAGPATNITSLSVLLGILGKRATAIYLTSIAVIAILAGLALDAVYDYFGISARTVAGQAAETLPHWLVLGSGILLLILSVQPLTSIVRGWFADKSDGCGCSASACDTAHDHNHSDCGCDKPSKTTTTRIQPFPAKDKNGK